MNNLLLHAMTNKFVDRWVMKLMGPSVTIYTLHRPSPSDHSFHGIDENLLERCLEFSIQRGYNFVSIDELVDAAVNGKELTKPTLCFTLDDGYADQLSRLVPTLLRYNAKPTLFVISDFVDQVDWPWDAKVAYIIWYTPLAQIKVDTAGIKLELDCSSTERRINSRRKLSHHAKSLKKSELLELLQSLEKSCGISIPQVPPKDYVPVTWQNLREYESQGLRVGAHSRSHFVLSALTDDEVLEELDHSRRRVHAELSNPSRVFCYPSGTIRDYSSSHPFLVEKSGFSSAVTTNSKPTNLDSIRRNPYQIDRIGFPETFEKFVRYSSWVEVLRNKL